MAKWFQHKTLPPSTSVTSDHPERLQASNLERLEDVVAAVNPQFSSNKNTKKTNDKPIGTSISHLDLFSYQNLSGVGHLVTMKIPLFIGESTKSSAALAFSCLKLGQRMTQDKSSASSWAKQRAPCQLPFSPCGETMAEK